MCNSIKTGRRNCIKNNYNYNNVIWYTLQKDVNSNIKNLKGERVRSKWINYLCAFKVKSNQLKIECYNYKIPYVSLTLTTKETNKQNNYGRYTKDYV